MAPRLKDKRTSITTVSEQYTIYAMSSSFQYKFWPRVFKTFKSDWVSDFLEAEPKNCLFIISGLILKFFSVQKFSMQELKEQKRN